MAVTNTKGDYIIYRESGKKRKRLAEIVSILPEDDGEESIKIIIESTNVDVNVREEEVLINLGPNPKYGSVYGVKVEPLKEIKTLKYWGEVRIYVELLQKVKLRVRSELIRAYKVLKKQGLAKFLPVDIELRHTSGKTIGQFKAMKKGQDIIVLRPVDFCDDPLDHTIFHEMGHKLWHRGLPVSYKAEWVSLYHEAVSLNTVDSSILRKIRREFQDSSMSIKEYKNSLEPEYVDIFNEVISWIAAKRHIKKPFLDIWIEAGLDLKRVWPKTKVDISQINTKVSDYADTTPEECWCEAFDLVLRGKALPQKFNELALKCIERLATGRVEHNVDTLL